MTTATPINNTQNAAAIKTIVNVENDELEASSIAYTHVFRSST
jgi:hypothetical protein